MPIVIYILVCIVHYICKHNNFMSLVVLLITECHNGDDFFVWTYDDVGLCSQSPKMVRPETGDKAVTHCLQLYSIVDIAIHCRMAEYFFGRNKFLWFPFQWSSQPKSLITKINYNPGHNSWDTKPIGHQNWGIIPPPPPCSVDVIHSSLNSTQSTLLGGEGTTSLSFFKR